MSSKEYREIDHPGKLGARRQNAFQADAFLGGENLYANLDNRSRPHIIIGDVRFCAASCLRLAVPLTVPPPTPLQLLSFFFVSLMKPAHSHLNDQHHRAREAEYQRLLNGD